MTLEQLITAADHEVWFRISAYSDLPGVANGRWDIFSADVFGGDKRTLEILEDLHDREIGDFWLEIIRDPGNTGAWVPAICVVVRIQ